VVSDSDWMSESIIFTFRIWFGYGDDEKVSDWIRIAKFSISAHHCWGSNNKGFEQKRD